VFESGHVLGNFCGSPIELLAETLHVLNISWALEL